MKQKQLMAMSATVAKSSIRHYITAEDAPMNRVQRRQMKRELRRQDVAEKKRMGQP